MIKLNKYFINAHKPPGKDFFLKKNSKIFVSDSVRVTDCGY